MANNSNNVTVGKPKVGGAVWVAPVGTTLPTDTTSTLGDAFKGLGYISEDGVTKSTAIDSTDIKAWGGDIVDSATSKTYSFKMKFIEYLNEEVLKFVYGSSAVTGSLETGLTIAPTSNDNEEVAMVIDMVLKNNVAERLVIPRAKLNTLGDIVYKGNDIAGYDSTIAVYPDATGKHYYDYIK